MRIFQVNLPVPLDGFQVMDKLDFAPPARVPPRGHSCRQHLLILSGDNYSGTGGFDILGGEFFRMPADTRIGMLQEPIEGLSLLSADDAFPSDKTLEVSQILPML
jgi:hypothetical protein